MIESGALPTKMTSVNIDIKIGFIGLGQMGLGMATMLTQANVPLLVMDLNTDSVAALIAFDTVNEASLSTIALECDLVFTCLPDEAAIEHLLFSKGGLLAVSGRLHTVIDTSTLNAECSREFATKALQTGVTYCDCPVSGLPKRAHNGTLTMMFGGSETAFELARPYLDIIGETVLHCGNVGSGQMTKAINNIVYDINIAAICEVLPLAVKAGLDPLILERLLTSGSSRSFASEHFIPKIMAGQFKDDFSLQAAHKDIVNVQQITEALKADTPLIDAMTGSYEKAIDAGFGHQPKSAMIKVYEEALGVTVRRGSASTIKNFKNT